MYRAIPEVNRICAMADRGRSYRLHQQALARIKNRPIGYKNSSSMSNVGSIPSYAGSSTNEDSSSIYARSTSLLSKAQKEKQIQIYNENQKILKAIEYQSPTICRADFYEHELDHQRQVSRMTGKQEIYGFPVGKDANKANANKKNKSKKNKNYDPEIVRPMPKKFDIASFENAESKSNSSNKKSQGNKNNGSNEGKLDDILSNNANGLCDASKNSSNNSKNKQNQKKKPQETTNKDKSGGDLSDIIADGVNELNSTPKTEDKEKDEKDEKEKDDEKKDDDDSSEDDEDGDLDKIVGNGVNNLTGDAKK